MNVYRVLAIAALTVHLAWIMWVIFGWLVTRKRPLRRWLHIASLLYSVLIETAPWPCPLTIAEQWLEDRAGVRPYHEPFLVHYLEALIYPEISLTLLTVSAVTTCLSILGIYALRFRKRQIAGW